MTDHHLSGREPAMLSFVKDLPNICSLAGLLCALLGIYFAILGQFNLAMIGILWAVLFDWADGVVARKMKNRPSHLRTFGPHLDSIIDMVSFGVFPAVFLMSYGQYKLWYLPGAFLILAAAAIRLSYFNIYGMVNKTTYRGLALDNNILILSLVFMFDRFFTPVFFSVIIYLLLLVLLCFNVSTLRTYKFGGRWFFVLIGYTIVMTSVLVLRALG